jgi:hypothetical protein
MDTRYTPKPSLNSLALIVRRTGQTKTPVIVAFPRPVPVTVSHAQSTRFVIKRTTTRHQKIATRSIPKVILI